jgi:hypothetical protein
MHQFIIFPIGIGVPLLWSGDAWVLGPWLDGPWEGASLRAPPADRVGAYLGLAYFLRDSITTELSPIYLLHHVAAIGSVLYAFALPVGGHALLLLSVVFEVGSGCAALSHIKQDDAFRRALFFWGMSISNVLGVALICKFALLTALSVADRALFSTVCVAFAIIRQQVSMASYRDYEQAALAKAARAKAD